MDEATFRMMMGTSQTDVSQQEWTQTGTYEFIVPNVVTLSAVCVSGGEGGQGYGGGNSGAGGYGGSLRYVESIPVTPFEKLTVVVGGGGPGIPVGSGSLQIRGASTYIARGEVILLSAACLNATGQSVPNSTPIGNGVGGGDGKPGGARGTTQTNAGQGGGAAGYDDQNGGGSSGQRGTPGRGGGGVGLKGQGASGAASTSSDPSGKGGSGGGNADDVGNRRGGLCGGGGGGGTNPDYASGGGGTGGCRIIWGPGRAYPSTNTQDV